VTDNEPTKQEILRGMEEAVLLIHSAASYYEDYSHMVSNKLHSLAHDLSSIRTIIRLDNKSDLGE
jgi:hypothetical protein